MIDLHSHILPGVDDGAQNMDEALAMARVAVEQGLTIVAATPHFFQIPDWELIQTKVVQLQTEIDKAQIPLQIVAGAEILIEPEFTEMATESIPTYGDEGRFCLLELPMQQIPLYTKGVIFALQARGITPIIAHPERYGAIVNDPNLALEWLNRGCLIQLNAGSILGNFGSKIRQTAEIMLTHNMVQLIGSDAHSLERRPFNLGACLVVLESLLGLDLAQDLLTNNPHQVLEGTYTTLTEARTYRKKRRFIFF